MSTTFDANRAKATPALPTDSLWWSGAGIAASQLTRILVATALARVLGPTEFAPVAIAAIYMTIIALLLDMGLVAAVIQRPHLTHRHLQVTAFINLITGCTICVITAGICVFGLATGWSETTVVFFLLLSVAPLIRSVGLLSQTMLYRGKHQAFLGRLEAFVAAGSLGCSLATVGLGAGLWSYSVQVLLTEVCLCVGWILRARPFTWPRWDWLAFRELWGFGSKSLGSDALALGTRNIDSLVLGWLSSATQLSFYSVAYRFLITPIQFFGQLTVRVALPELSDLHRRSVPVGHVVMAYTRRLSVTIWPIMGLAVCLGPRAVSTVLGTSWAPIVPVVRALCIAGAFQTSLAMMAPAMLAVGAVSASVRYALSLFVVSSVVYLLTASQGASSVAVACAVVSGVFAVVLGCVVSRVLNSPLRTTLTAILSGIPLFSAVVLPAWLSSALFPQFSEGQLLADAIAGASFALILVLPRVRKRLAGLPRRSRVTAVRNRRGAAPPDAGDGQVGLCLPADCGPAATPLGPIGALDGSSNGKPTTE